MGWARLGSALVLGLCFCWACYGFCLGSCCLLVLGFVGLLNKIVVQKKGRMPIGVVGVKDNKFLIRVLFGVSSFLMLAISWNVRGLGRKDKRRVVRNLVRNFKPSVLFL